MSGQKVGFLSLLLVFAATQVHAQGPKTISIVGRIVDDKGMPVEKATVVLAIGSKAQVDKSGRLSQDKTDANGIFQLVKYPVHQITELYVWVEPPNVHPSIRVETGTAEVLQTKLDQLKIEGTPTGPMKKAEGSRSVSALFDIWMRKAELGLEDHKTAQQQFEDQAKQILSRTQSVDDAPTIEALLEEASKQLGAADLVRFVAATADFGRRLGQDAQFKTLVAKERAEYEDLSKFIPAYMNGQVELDVKHLSYIKGFDPRLFRPEWFATDVASKSLWDQYKPTDPNKTQRILVYPYHFNGGGDGKSGLAIDASTLPDKSAIRNWVEINPDGGKLIFKSRALYDPKIPQGLKTDIMTQFKGFDPTLLYQ